MFWTRWAWVCLVYLAVLASARPGGAVEAQARPATPAAAASPTPPYRLEVQPNLRKRPWYGYQTLAVDAAAVGMIFAAGALEPKRLGWVALGTGVGTYLLGAPLVHWAHGNAALPSFVRRLVPPAIVAAGTLACLETAEASPWIGEHFGLPGVVVGVAATCGWILVGISGFPAVMIVDAALANEPEEPPSSTGPQSLVVPSYDPTRRAGMLSWAGTF